LPRGLNGDGANAPNLFRKTGAAPAQRTQTGNQFGDRKGLGQVVVRARVQTVNAIGQSISRCQHHHRQGVAGLAQRIQHVQARTVLQTNVQKRGLEVFGLQQFVGVSHLAHPHGLKFTLR
jgi:hypothetical protein